MGDFITAPFGVTHLPEMACLSLAELAMEGCSVRSASTMDGDGMRRKDTLASGDMEDSVGSMLGSSGIMTMAREGGMQTQASVTARFGGGGGSSWRSSSGTPEGESCGPAPAPAQHILIAATDGLWEWIDNETAVSIAGSMPSAEAAAHALVEAAHKQWAVVTRGQHCDDVTVAVAFIPVSQC